MARNSRKIAILLLLFVLNQTKYASSNKKVRFRAFLLGIVCFCTINGYFRILKKIKKCFIFCQTAVMKMNSL